MPSSTQASDIQSDLMRADQWHLLLQDKTSKRNILWGSDTYAICRVGARVCARQPDNAGADNGKALLSDSQPRSEAAGPAVGVHQDTRRGVHSDVGVCEDERHYRRRVVRLFARLLRRAGQAHRPCGVPRRREEPDVA